MKEVLSVFSALLFFLTGACVPTDSASTTELSDTYRILVGAVSDLDNLDSIATHECRIEVPILYEVTSKTSYGELLEAMDFAKIWIEEDPVWYVLGKWNYITINAEEDACFVSSDIGDFSAHAQEIFEKLESHPEFFVQPGPVNEPFRWNGKGEVTMEQLEAPAGGESAASPAS